MRNILIGGAWPYDKAACGNTLFQCVQIIANLAVLLSPFLPFSSEKVRKWLSLEARWERQSVPAGYVLPEVEVLFQRIDKKVIDIETEKLKTLQEPKALHLTKRKEPFPWTFTTKWRLPAAASPQAA